MPEISTPVCKGLFYRKMGNGPVLILIHGFPSDGTVWSQIQQELSESFTLLIPDLPGSGSSHLEGIADIGYMTDCIKALMGAEGIKKAVIAGHSMGGYVGCEFAVRYPDLVAGLSLIHSVPVADDEEKKNLRLKSIELIRKGGKSTFIRQLIPNLFSNNFKQTNPAVVESQVKLALELDDKSLINFYYAMIGRRDNRSALIDSGFPIQWIIGMDDNVIFYKKILELCYKSQINFVTFKNNCGHMSMLETPASLITDLKEFTEYCFHYDPHV